MNNDKSTKNISHSVSVHFRKNNAKCRHHTTLLSNCVLKSCLGFRMESFHMWLKPKSFVLQVMQVNHFTNIITHNQAVAFTAPDFNNLWLAAQSVCLREKCIGRNVSSMGDSLNQWDN